MKKYVFFLCIYLSVPSAFATVYCSHTINVNDNFSIDISFQDNLKSDITTGIYFDLLVWAKNAENELTNANKKVILDYSNNYFGFVMYISNNDSVENAYSFYYDGEKKGMKTIKYITADEMNDESDFIIVEEYFLKGTKDLTKAIITRLNIIFKTNNRYDNFNTVELFVKNNKENEAKHTNAKIYSDYIYINREELMKNIKEKGSDYFIETIKINRKEIDNIVEVSSWLCG